MHGPLKFDVVVWVKKTESFPSLRDELLGLAVHDVYESTESGGMIDFHWRFDSLKEAESVAEALSVLRDRPELVLLRLSNYEDPDASITYKDVRDVRS